ncbi:hypothetical protein L1D59_05040 [Pseudoalteromonas piscicida]|uniref:hypothetical protein n=1 Tax=Pseudoalteromonas piscicida TaxID=43662 RepID=UPI001EFD582D|nr:hypothetical protein [Pseudoalteromonas piscicida]MCG9767963.1 hypothetical protein [Pseudoalteromonas piscicida]
MPIVAINSATPSLRQHVQATKCQGKKVMIGTAILESSKQGQLEQGLVLSKWMAMDKTADV